MDAVRVGELVANRFELEEIVGAGGMGIVYRARDRYTGNLVAVKLLHNQEGASGERFSREAQFLAELRHPGIVTYVAHGTTLDGQCYLAMEWLEGEDLAERLRHGPLPLPKAIELIRAVSSALAFVHAKGIVHRDLKPNNLFLVGGQTDRVKVLDFGIARQLSGVLTLTQAGAAIGTPQYMAPEQARGEKTLTPSTDIFALGCILYECLAGQPPFVGEHAMAVLVRILLEDPEPLSARLLGIPMGVVTLLQRMLAKNSLARPANAAALVEELDALGILPMLQARPPPSAAPSGRILTDREHQLLCVVIAVPRTVQSQAAAREDKTEGLTQSIGERAAQDRDELERELRRLGAQVEWLMDGTLVAAVAGQSAGSSAADQAALAARCALLIKRKEARSEVAIGTGRGLIQQHLPAGEAVERALKLLRTRTRKDVVPQEKESVGISGVWLDAVSEGLLGGQFGISRFNGTALLQEELGGASQEIDQTRRLMGKPTPCVGREAELHNLEGQLATCIDESEARALIIIAPPGAGKSRLRHEFQRRVDQRGTELTLLQGRGNMVNAGTPYGVLAQAVQRLCGIRGCESTEEQQRAVATRIGSIMEASQRTRVTEFMGELAGIRFADDGSGRLLAAREDPRIMRDQILRAFIEWLQAECKRSAVLIVLDDLHWGDGLSVGLVDEALRELRCQPLMALALGRPELKKIFPKLWQGHKSQEIFLQSLSKKACGRLVQQVLGQGVSAEVMERIVEQAGGNALFLEELIRAAGEGNADGKSETVVAMLQARIGRLGAGPRRVIRAASIYGQTFYVGGVAALLGVPTNLPELAEWLSELVELEMIERRGDSRLDGGDAYRFRHALLCDAAYSLILANDLKTGHLLASQYLEQAGETDGMVLGGHAERGGDLPRALSFFTQAAEQAFSRYDLQGALSRAECAMRCGPEGEALGILYALQSAVLFWSNDFERGFELGQRALALMPKGSVWWGRNVQNLVVIASCLPDMSPMHKLAEHCADETLEQMAPIPCVQAVGTLVMELGILGERARARHFLAMAEKVCGQLATDQGVARGYLDACRAWQVICSEPNPWLAYCCGQQAGRLHRTAEDWRSLMISELALALSLGELGDNQQGIETARQMLVLSERLREPFMVLASKAYLLYLLASRPGDHLGAEASTLIDETKQAPLFTVQGLAHIASARFALYRNDPVYAESEARAAIRSLPIMLPYRLAAFTALINALLVQGRQDEARATAEEGMAQLAGAGGAGFTEVPLRLAASETFYAAGDSERARAEHSEVLRQIQIRADSIADLTWRDSYLSRNPTCVHAQQLSSSRFRRDQHDVAITRIDSDSRT